MPASGEALSPRGSVHSANGGLAAPLLAAQDSDGEADVVTGAHDRFGEFGRLSRLAFPLILQNLAGYMLSIVSAAFIGHLNDPVALSSAVLAGSFFNITGFSLVIGLAAGMETLCGQAYGAGNYKMLGLVLQRALLICWAACVPVALFWSQSHRVLAYLHQQPEIVEGASRYLHIATPALFLSVVSSCLYRYLVAQQEVRPSTLCTLATALLCPLYNWLLIYRLRMGLDGAAWAFVASNGTYSALLAAYTVARDWRLARAKSDRQTWPGLSARAFAGWGTYLRFALPSAAMICMEWWIFELVIFMSGTLGPFADVAVAVMGLTFNISSWTYMIPMSLGTAVNTRVSNSLGAGSAVAARTAARTAVAAALCIQLCIAAGLFAGRRSIVKAFTTQPDIVYHVGRLMPVLAVSVVGDGLVAVLGGVLRGSGRQSLGAAFNLIGYWAVGCPVALLLGLRAHMNVLGFWCGLATATSLQAVILGCLVYRFNWDREVERAAKLVSEHAGRPLDQDQEQAQGQAQDQGCGQGQGQGQGCHSAGRDAAASRERGWRPAGQGGTGDGRNGAAAAAAAGAAQGGGNGHAHTHGGHDVEAPLARCEGDGSDGEDSVRRPLLARHQRQEDQ